MVKGLSNGFVDLGTGLFGGNGRSLKREEIRKENPGLLKERLRWGYERE